MAENPGQQGKQQKNKKNIIKHFNRLHPGNNWKQLVKKGNNS